MLDYTYRKTLVYFICVTSVTCFLNTDIIIGFSKSNNANIGSGTIFHCANQKEKVSVSKKLMRFGLQFLFVDLRDDSIAIDTVLQGKNCHLVVVLDGDCENITHILNKVTEKNYFYETLHWAITTKSKEYTLNVLKKVKLNINSDLHLVVPENNENNDYTIYDVYNPASEHGGQLIVTVLGHYNEIDGYKIEINNDNKYWRRRNMTGVIFKTAVVLPFLEKPLIEYLLADDEKRQDNSMHRFQSICVNYCKDFYNFTLQLQTTNSWGYVQSNGHFDGLVSLLERKVVDFGSSPLLFKLDRLPVVDYGYGNWILRSAFIYRRPKVTAPSYEIFLRPLGKWVWISICFIMVAIIAILKLVCSSEKAIEHFVKVRSSRNLGSVDSSWSFLFLFTLGAFCQQGATFYPKLFSGRILSVFVYLFCIIIYQFYSASIVSYLLMDPPRTINNLRDLVDSHLRVGIEDILIDRNYFAQTTDPYAIQLHEKNKKGGVNNSGYYSPIEGLDLVRGGGFAFHVETSTAYPIIERTFSNEFICELEEIQMYSTQPMYTNLQKKSPFREMLNYCMFKMAETGNMDRLRKHWNARKPSCIEYAKKVEIHVSFNEFSCGPMVLLSGVTLALILLLAEIVIYHRDTIFGFFVTKAKRTSVYPYID